VDLQDAGGGVAADPGIRDRILRAGARLFSEHGYDSVSLRHICEEARVSKGAIYHHFASKEDLFVAIVAAALEQLLHHARLSMAGEAHAAGRLRAFIIGQAELFDTEANGCRVAMSRLASLFDSREGRARVEELRRRYIRTLQKLFADGIAAGEFARIDVRAATRMVLAILYWLARWYEPVGRSSAVEIAAAHADIMLRGVCKR
jgi:AcrR family transcriptional regulator